MYDCFGAISFIYFDLSVTTVGVEDEEDCVIAGKNNSLIHSGDWVRVSFC